MLWRDIRKIKYNLNTYFINKRIVNNIIEHKWLKVFKHYINWLKKPKYLKF